jgi:ubiquinone/menaquinone biosynthesis C-methylase UbiE
MNISKGFRKAIILLSANEVGVFDLLGSGKFTCEELSEKSGLKIRGTRIVLNALVNMGFLGKSKDRYFNKPDIIQYLTRVGSSYMGASLKHDFNLMNRWITLPEILKTGVPARNQNQKRDKNDQESFILTMANVATPQMKTFYSNINLKKCKRFLDVGGGPGVYSLFAQKYFPNLKATNFDLPETIEIAKRFLDKFPEGKNVELIEGDYYNDEFGTDYDAILLSSVIHSLGESDIKTIFKKSFKALNEGGIIIVKEFFFNKDRTSPEKPALFAVNMLVNTENGDCYTSEEVKIWLKEIGFKKIVYKNISSEVQFVVGVK